MQIRQLKGQRTFQEEEERIEGHKGLRAAKAFREHMSTYL